MESFKTIYRVTEEFITTNPTFVLEEDNNLVGFYGISINNKETALEYLYVKPKEIGKGYGKLLWSHMISTCESLGIETIDIVTSPQAKDFYIKMGAIHVEEVNSLVIKDRRIPELIYKIREK